MKTTIAVILTVDSAEKAISVKTGNIAYSIFIQKKYMPNPVIIIHNRCLALDMEGKEYLKSNNDFSFFLGAQKIVFDCVFNAIHGNPGENGVLLAYFELIGVTHTSASSYQMALTFNKRDTLSVVKEYGIKTATSYYLNKGSQIDLDAIIAKVGLPCFVKPNNAGSSFGISKAYSINEMMPAIQKAFEQDSEILIESFLEGSEVSVGVIQYQQTLKVLPITAIVSENDFFDYEAKYQGKSSEITPAVLSPEIQEKVVFTAKKVYNSLNLSGFSRAEFILVEGEPYFLEINTVPGLTEESILPQQAACAGISLSQLFDNAIQSALN